MFHGSSLGEFNYESKTGHYIPNSSLILHISIYCETLMIIVVCLNDRSGNGLETWLNLEKMYVLDIPFSSTYSTLCMLSVSLCNIDSCTLHSQLQCNFAGILHIHGTTDQGRRLFERSHSPLQFPSVLLCTLVGLDLCLSGAILVTAHIQVPKNFQMRNYPLGSS